MKKTLLILILLYSFSSFAQTALPNAELTTLDGKSVDINDEIQQDKITIVSFWATWCVPCINELNAINNVYPTWQQESNIELIAVSVDDARTQKRIKPLVSGKAWPYKVLIDKNQELKRALNITSVPYLIVIKNGEIVHRHSGYSVGSEKELYQTIQNISDTKKSHNLSVGFESNMQYYLDDEKTGDFTEKDRFRSNNYLKLDYSYKKFQVGAQIEGYEPHALLNYSPNLDKTNIALYYARFKSKKIDVIAGHFYEQFGSGLILRSWEDRQLGINNALLGGRVKYSPIKSLNVTALYAKQRYGFKISEGDIFAANTEIQISELLQMGNSNLKLGASYVGRNQDVIENDESYNKLTNAISARLDFSFNKFYSSVEYVNKSEDAVILFDNVVNVKPGNALLFNAGFVEKGLGVDFTFRRMENMTFYSDREANGNIYNENIINYLPALTKQHDYLLTNIYVYQAQPAVSFLDPSLMKSGEIGGQLDVYYKLEKGSILGGRYGTKIALNASYWSGLSGDYDYENLDYNNERFGFGERYFSDISLEIRKRYTESLSTILYYVNQNYNKKFIEGSKGEINANILITDLTYEMKKGRSIRLVGQHLWSENDKKNWIGGTCEFYLNPQIAFYVNDIYNYGNDHKDKAIHYYNIGGSYSHKGYRFALNYGRQRGGLLCIGGVCRTVPESTGISASISMSF